MSRTVRHVLIVGGGSAGWLAAGVLAARHRTAQSGGLQVTLLESPDKAPIGVGEGTWPTMRDTLRAIGVSESGLVRHCDASFKQGSRFDGWIAGGDAQRDGDRYLHPFSLPLGYGDADLVTAWLHQHAQRPFAEVVGPQPLLCARSLAPKQFTTPEYAAVANYAYHFDAAKFGPWLRDHCVGVLGVRHVRDEMVAVVPQDNGDIAALQTRDHGLLAADLFVDCTGMPSLLLGRHFGVPLLSQRDVLFCDTALALQVPYGRADHPIASQTISTAQAAGWIWDIGLSSRRGIGHVYSSAHTSDDAAETALRRYIAASGGPADTGTPRKISFTPGHRERFWHRNCVAIGLSAGFIEPLEASALALVELSAAMLADELPATREAMDIVARRFNEAFSYRWSRIIEFLKLHYVLSQRTDSDFWRDNRRAESVPERLRELLLLWRHRPPSRADLHRVEEVFPSASWQYVLYGMGFRPEPHPLPPRASDLAAAEGHFREAADLARRMAGALPDHRALIEHIRRHGQPSI
jgi:flavin-dependent dehydrogenase